MPLPLVVDFDNALVEAYMDFVTRNPQLAADYKLVQKLYMGPDAFSLAGEISQSVLDAVKQAIENALLKGQSRKEFAEEAKATWLKDAETAGWTNLEARLELIYRTNMATAMAAGRISRAREISILGFERQTAHDSDVRPNHLAAHGLVYSIDDPDLQWFSLPWGYNERCTDVGIDEMTADKMGRLTDDGEFIGMTRREWEDVGAFPDDGFEKKWIKLP